MWHFTALTMYNFCTLFETNYLSRGLALYESLVANEPNSHLYILAFNEETYSILKELKLEKATLISLKEFENDKLLAVKPSRGVGEYCWTSTSSLIKYCIEEFSLDHCIYLDSDLYFFKSPKELIDEVSDNSILITEHRYTPKYDQSLLSGKYCVQFMYFKNDEAGMTCLNWWTDACIEWCFNRHEDGKFGDQKYLDDWCERFEKVHELKHLGGGVAPWNTQQYQYKKKANQIEGLEISSTRKFDLIFYHFHELQFLEGGKVNLCNYELSKDTIELLYKPYMKHLNEINRRIQHQFGVRPYGISRQNPTFVGQLRRIKNRLKNSYHIYPTSYFS